MGYDASKGCNYAAYDACASKGSLRAQGEPRTILILLKSMLTNFDVAAECYCDFFQLQADCWGQGICCTGQLAIIKTFVISFTDDEFTEWPAHAAVAADVCRYAKGCGLKSSILKAKVADAYAVVMQT